MKRRLKQILRGVGFLSLIGLASISTFPREEHYSLYEPKEIDKFLVEGGIDEFGRKIKIYDNNGISLGGTDIDNDGEFDKIYLTGVNSANSELAKKAKNDSLNKYWDRLTKPRK